MGKNNDNLMDILKVEGVNAKGYGIAPKTVMQDQRLTRDAKAIYCYFASFAGKGDTAFPGVSKICFDLGFKTEDTYRKHFKMLKNYDYIRVIQRRISGKFDSNIYILVSNPNPQEQDPDNKGADPNPPTPKKPGYGEKKSRPSNKPTPKKTGYGEIPPSKNQGSNSNSPSKNNSSFINNNMLLPELEIFRNIKCRHNTYSLTDDHLQAIAKPYKDIQHLSQAIEYIKANEPQEGYGNVIGAIIKASKWDISPASAERRNNKQNSHKKNRFHNFDQRSSNYTPEQIEAIAKRKRMEHKNKRSKEDILNRLI